MMTESCGLALATTLVLIAIHLFVLSALVRAVWKGDIMWSGKDVDEDENC